MGAGAPDHTCRRGEVSRRPNARQSALDTRECYPGADVVDRSLGTTLLSCVDMLFDAVERCSDGALLCERSPIKPLTSQDTALPCSAAVARRC
jgi:hypothetical protein